MKTASATTTTTTLKRWTMILSGNMRRDPTDSKTIFLSISQDG
jgi:hypothetical protein